MPDLVAWVDLSWVQSPKTVPPTPSAWSPAPTHKPRGSKHANQGFVRMALEQRGGLGGVVSGRHCHCRQRSGGRSGGRAGRGCSGGRRASRHSPGHRAGRGGGELRRQPGPRVGRRHVAGSRGRAAHQHAGPLEHAVRARGTRRGVCSAWGAERQELEGRARSNVCPPSPMSGRWPNPPPTKWSCGCFRNTGCPLLVGCQPASHKKGMFQCCKRPPNMKPSGFYTFGQEDQTSPAENVHVSQHNFSPILPKLHQF